VTMQEVAACVATNDCHHCLQCASGRCHASGHGHPSCVVAKYGVVGVGPCCQLQEGVMRALGV
jgi:hypothetical protein